MNKVFLPQFNHAITLMGGQSFAWSQIAENAYVGSFQDKVVSVKFKGDDMYWQTYPENDDFAYIQKLFRLNVTYEEIIKSITRDQKVKHAVNRLPGIHVLQQPVEQTILSFIISANKNIKSIRESVRILSKMLGNKVSVDGEIYYTFPSTETFSENEESFLRLSKIGFRAKYVKKTAELLKEGKGIYFKNLASENSIRDQLTNFPGVGNKIADCVLAFSLGFDNVSPVDVWTKRFLVDLYGLSDKLSYLEYREWIKRHFYGYALWALQFLFEWYRTEGYYDRKSNILN